jgi:tetratricopeptide (TPR) repeat protein
MITKDKHRMDAATQHPQHIAEDLFFAAMEAADDVEALTLLIQAAAFDPTNVDVWLALMNFARLNDDEQTALLRHLVARGATALGARMFREAKGNFWGMLETRPYMRARFRLAMHLMRTGRLEESIVEHEALLELCPNDNLGARYSLLALYLALARLDGAAQILQRYNERGFSTIWAWGRVLERYLAKDLKGAGTALRQAQQQNPHAQAYFVGQRKLPRAMPDEYAMGSREEAVIAWDTLQHAWKRHGAAMAWLKTQCAP